MPTLSGFTGGGGGAPAAGNSIVERIATVSKGRGISWDFTGIIGLLEFGSAPIEFYPDRKGGLQFGQELESLTSSGYCIRTLK
jgi:hypothetical protein